MAKPDETRRAVAAQIPEGRVGISLDIEAAQILIGVLRLVGGMPGREAVFPRDWMNDLYEALEKAVPQGTEVYQMPWRKFVKIEGATFCHPPEPGAVPRRRYR